MLTTATGQPSNTWLVLLRTVKVTIHQVCEIHSQGDLKRGWDWLQCPTSVIPGFGKSGQEDQEFKASLGYLACWRPAWDMWAPVSKEETGTDEEDKDFNHLHSDKLGYVSILKVRISRPSLLTLTQWDWSLICHQFYFKSNTNWTKDTQVVSSLCQCFLPTVATRVQAFSQCDFAWTRASLENFEQIFPVFNCEHAAPNCCFSPGLGVALGDQLSN